MVRFIKPNFKKSNLNISATMAEFLGAPNSNSTLPVLKRELNKNYKNVVFIIFDGLGINPIAINLEKNAILRKGIVKMLVSTFPSTTTNATTSLATNTYPLQHGWLGWSLNFPEIHRNLDIYMGKDSQTAEKVEYKMPLADNTEYYFDMAHTDYQINSIFMPYCKVKNAEQNTYVTDHFQLCAKIKEIINRPTKQFVYAYYENPDHIMHVHGVSSAEAKNNIQSINDQIQKLYDESHDTLFVITADHGQVDITDYIEFYSDKVLNDMLVCPAYLDARAVAFRVKDECKKDFEKQFKAKYSKDFVLFKSSDLIKKGYFGKSGDKSSLLGDYIAIGTYTNKQFLYSKNCTRFKGHHTSLTKEMLVPLIMLKKH